MRQIYKTLILLSSILIICSCSSKQEQDFTGDGITRIGSGSGIGGYALSNDDFEVLPKITEVHFSNIYFSYDSFRIERTEVSKIEQLADYMRKHSNVRLMCSGHCDERGTKEYNLSLGENRALAVRAYLIGLGISPDYIQTKSYGEEMPVALGHNESAWRQNRRVEFDLYRAK